MSTSQNSERGINTGRIEFVREEIDDELVPYPPADPNYEAYSDTFREFTWTPGPNIEGQYGLFDVDPDRFEKGPEEHQMTVAYDLQRQIATSGGDPADALYDAIQRDSGNDLPNSHTVIQRQSIDGLAPGNTVNGVTAKDTYLYTVGIGGKIDEAEVIGDPGEEQALIGSTLNYEFEHVRSYQFDQPESANVLAVHSTDAGDTTQTVVLESDDGVVREEITLDGQNDQFTTADFDSLEAVWITSDPTTNEPTSTQGDVEVFVSPDGVALGDQLATLEGAQHYDDVEGDYGVPPVGNGSHAGAVGTDYEKFIGDRFTHDGGDLAMDINSFGVTVTNNVERTPREDSFRQRTHEGIRETEVAVTVVGQQETHDKTMMALSNVSADIVWEMGSQNLRFPGASLTEPGDRSYEAEQAVVQPDNTFLAEGVVIE